MKKKALYILAILFLLFSCESQFTEECSCLPPQKITFKTGTSYGFCAGYCFRELTIGDDLTTYFKQSSNYPGPDENPDVVVDSNITQVKYDELLQALNQSGFFSLNDTLSDCLDCADQGAEWVEIQQPGFTKKVVFDAGADVKEMEQLLTLLRDLRDAYE